MSQQQGVQQSVHSLRSLLNHSTKSKNVAAAAAASSSSSSAAASSAAAATAKQIQSPILASSFGCNCLLRTHFIRLFSSAGLQELHSSPERNVVISAHAKNGEAVETIQLYQQMLQSGRKPSIRTFAAVLNACASIASLSAGKTVHLQIIERGLGSEVLLGNSLVKMYSRCGSLAEAREVFVNLPQRDVVSWNSIISACVAHRRGEEAVEFYDRMQGEGFKPDRVTYLCVLKACGICQNISRTKRIHRDLMQSGSGLDDFLASALVDIYSKCGRIDSARRVFGSLSQRNVVLWTAMIAGLVRNGCGREAMQMFEKMQEERVKPNAVTFLCAVKACASISALERGKLIHHQIIAGGFDSDPYVGNALIDMYARCRSIELASHVFCKLPKRDVVSWNAMISGYVQCGQEKQALKLFAEMKREGFKPNKVTILGLLKACSKMSSPEHGKRIHRQLAQTGIELDLTLGNVLIDMYAKCQSTDQAFRVFLEMQERDVVSWSTMIDGFARQGEDQKAIWLFQKMQQEGVKPNEFTFACVLKACGSLMDLDQGKIIHAQLKHSSLKLDTYLGNALLDMYVRCSSLGEAQELFLQLPERDVVSWSTIIHGLAPKRFDQAFLLFQRMQEEGIRPDKVTYVGLLKACGEAIALDQGKLIHSQLADRGLDLDPLVANTLIDMYAKCGSIDQADQVFLKLPIRDLISWNAIIDAYAQQGCGQEALNLFKKMLDQDIKPDKITFVCLLSACSRAGLLNQGRLLFKSMHREFGVVPVMKHYTCMVDLLGRSGKIFEALDLLNRMPIAPDAEAWMSLLGSCRAYANMEVARVCYESIVSIDPKNASAYILMSSIYAAAGRPIDEQEIQKQMAVMQRTDHHQPDTS